MTFLAVVSHNPEHWNSTCRATIPAVWECEVVDFPQDFRDAFKMDQPGHHFRIYGVSDTRQGAIQDVIDDLKRTGFSGKLKVVNA